MRKVVMGCLYRRAWTSSRKGGDDGKILVSSSCIVEFQLFCFYGTGRADVGLFYQPEW